MKEKFYAFLTWLARNKMLLANVAAIIAAYKLMQHPAMQAERDTLEAICAALGLTGTTLIRSLFASNVTRKDPP